MFNIKYNMIFLLRIDLYKNLYINIFSLQVVCREVERNHRIPPDTYLLQ